MKLSRYNTRLILVATLLVGLFILYSRFDRPRVLAVGEVPIAFWAWRTQAPSAADMRQARAATDFKTLFLRVGQFDINGGEVTRIRPLTGAMPADVQLHLVYNSTRRFLADFASIPVDHTAAAVVKSFRSDLERAAKNGAVVVGLQLDLDIPTRLLPKYAELLGIIRKGLPSGTDLSITGLPTWATTSEIENVLDNIDFWIPQFYGGKIPMHVDQRTPISSPADVARSVVTARRLRKPFYAGLAAYSYAIVYGTDGDLIEIRGDIDPATAATHASLDMVGHEPASNDRAEARYEYRANSDVVIDGLIVRKDQALVFDIPSSASLRESARVVRENAGHMLLGICLFRLPTTEDKAVLGINEISAALAETETKVGTLVSLNRISPTRIELRAKNKGTARSILGAGAMVLDLRVPPGTVGGIHPSALSIETLCGDNADPTPCSLQRANVIRVRSASWAPTDGLSLHLDINALPSRQSATVTTSVDDGRTLRESFELKLSENNDE